MPHKNQDYSYMKENEKRLLAVFKKLGITRVYVFFDGSGDSGQIEDIEIQGAEDELLKTATVTLTVDGGHEFDPEKKRWVELGFIEKTLPLKKAIEAHVYDHLERTGIDWYNDEGGFGSWIWTINDGLEFDIHVRFTKSSCEYFEERELGEDVE